MEIVERIAASPVDYDALRRRVRLLVLLDGSEQAGISPIRLNRLHTYAYLSNVLAPVWQSEVFDGRILKRRGGPFYPALQHELDRLVGLGLVTISDVDHFQDGDGQWRLDASFSINHQLADDSLGVINSFPEEFSVRSFLLEVAYALSALTDDEVAGIAGEDPTYSDLSVGYENVIDFAEWRNLNYSANVANHFSTVLERATPGELLHLFVRHLHRRMSDD